MAFTPNLLWKGHIPEILMRGLRVAFLPQGHWDHSASYSLFIRPQHRAMLSLGILMQQVELWRPSLQLHEDMETPPDKCSPQLLMKRAASRF
jgi:hypothetical protein